MSRCLKDMQYRLIRRIYPTPLRILRPEDEVAKIPEERPRLSLHKWSMKDPSSAPLSTYDRSPHSAGARRMNSTSFSTPGDNFE